MTTEMIVMSKNMIKTENWPICEMNIFPSTMERSLFKNNILRIEGVL